LFDNDGGRFAIDSTTGVVTVAGAINREADGASRSITVRATSSDGSYTDQIFAITINDVDEFDVGTVTDTNATSNNVNENASVGTVVGITASASDADSTNNTITYSLFDNDGGRFAIDSTTGVVTVAGAINREAMGLPATSPCEPLQATDLIPIRSLLDRHQRCRRIRRRNGHRHQCHQQQCQRKRHLLEP
jgi:protocadherin Fat 4